MSDLHVQAPPVVAVVVTRDPGPWLEETLRALGAQDYPALSVLVLDAASAEDPTARVAAVLPDAYVRRLDEDLGFGAAANHAIEMVHGAPLLLLCHDDVVPDPDAVHQMVEEAYRSNAGVVAPKQVGWVDPTRLLHVGMAVDKGGAVVDRVLPLELDHGQHDTVRDVFMAPGGFTLVRADLFEELGGFDPLVGAMGEDLDLSWRAQVAGARVVVAPAARVRHLELLAGGLRPPPAGAEPGPSLQALQRRHELYVVLKVYSPATLVRVVPQLLVLAVAEVIVGLVTGHRQRAVAVAGAWRWAVRHRSAVRAGRAAVAASRRVSDGELRRLQLRGSARLTSYMRRATTYGLHMAHLDAESMVADGGSVGVVPTATVLGQGALVPPDDRDVVAGAVGGTGAAAPVEAGDGADESADDGAPAVPAPAAGPAPAGGRPALSLSNRLLSVVSLAKGDVPDLRDPSAPRTRQRTAAEVNRGLRLRATAWAAVVVVALYGSRSLLSGGFPLLGQLLPLPSWGGLWHQLVVGWHPSAGVGGTAPSSPGLGELGVLATVLFGSVGLVQTVVVLGCLPLGGLGVYRLARPCGSPRARLVATVVYLALPVPYDDLATGHWQALVVYAAVPWIAGVLARSARLEPFAARPVARGEDEAGPPGRRWRHSPFGHVLALGLLEAAFGALAPQVLVVTLVAAAGLALGSLAVGGWGSARAAGRLVAVAAGATVVALVLLVPWSVGILASGSRWLVLFGPHQVATGGPGLGALLRFAVGPVGDTPLAYAFLVAGFLPLVIGGRWRLAWATRLWALAVLAWVLAWVTGRGWAGGAALPLGALLAPAGLAMALGAGLAVAALEADLPRYRFGWRQIASVLGGVAVLVSLLPVLAAATTGRWDLPAEGWQPATSFMAGRGAQGQYRVLWLGDPALLPGPSWPVGPGLAGELTEGPTPDLTSVLTVPEAGPLSGLVTALREAEDGRTEELGAALAPFAVHYVVVADSLAPTILGYQSAVRSTAPTGLVGSLDRQLDLQALSSESGYQVFADPYALPERAVTRPDGAAQAVLPGPSGADRYTGPVPGGTLRVAVAPPGSWTVTTSAGRVLPGRPTGPAAVTFDVPSGVVAVAYGGSWAHGLLLVVELLLVLASAAALAGRRIWLAWWWEPLRRRSPTSSGRVRLPLGGRHRAPATPRRTAGRHAVTREDRPQQVAP